MLSIRKKILMKLTLFADRDLELTSEPKWTPQGLDEVGRPWLLR